MTDDLVSAAELARLLADLADPTDAADGARVRPVRVLDVRWSLATGADRDAYAAGHVPGAVFCDLDAVLADPPGSGGRHPLPDPRRVQSWLASHLIGVDDDVVVYDERDSVAAARAWWVLRWVGQERVRVLDGGWQAWLAVAGEVDTAPHPAPDPALVDLEPAPRGAASVAEVPIDEVLDIAARGVLLDARAAERYRGEIEPIDPVAGHIPGAVSAPTTDNVDSDGRFLAPEVLRKRFAALGVDRERPVAVYCGSGVTAAHEILALRRAGLDAALFAGSWSAWVSDGTRPVARGAEPGSPTS